MISPALRPTGPVFGQLSSLAHYHSFPHLITFPQNTTDMDESSAQLLHKHRQAEATLCDSMSGNSAGSSATMSTPSPSISSTTSATNQDTSTQPNKFAQFNNTGHINMSSPLQGAPTNTMEGLKS